MTLIIFLILGLLTSLLFPPYFFTPLGFIIFPLICFLITNQRNDFRKLNFFLNGSIYGFALFLSLLFWLKNPFLVFEETKNFTIIFLLLIVLLALIFGIIFLFLNLIFRRLSVILLVPTIFTIFEIVISNILYGFPWITFSLITANLSSQLMIVKYFGSLATSFSIIFIFCLPYIYLYNGLKKLEYFAICIFVFPIIFILIFNLINIKDHHIIDNKTIDIEIFQLNNKISENINKTKKLNIIIENISKSNSELIIFGENNYPYIVKDLDFFEIQNIMKEKQNVIIGGTRFEKNKYYNTIFNITKNKVLYFDKKILVPFGEFIPFRDKLKFFETISGPSDFEVGDQKRYFSLDGNFSYIPIICYEIIFYWKIINSINKKSDFIINITNDVWFGNLIGPYQHFYLTKLRSSEFNKTIIRVSNNGISAIFDKNSNIIYNTDLNKKMNFRKKIVFESTDSNFLKLHTITNYILYFSFLFFIFINYKEYD